MLLVMACVCMISIGVGDAYAGMPSANDGVVVSVADVSPVLSVTADSPVVSSDDGVVLTANGDCLPDGVGVDKVVWEMLVPRGDGTSVWARIQGTSGATLAVTMPMASMAMYDGIVTVRARLDCPSGIVWSSSVTLAVDGGNDGKDIEKANTTDDGAQVDGVTVTASSINRPMAVLPDASKADTYNIVVNYIFSDNSIAADPFVATVRAGSSFSRHVDFPTIMGYDPYVGDGSDSVTGIDLSYDAVTSNETVTVVYKPGIVNYKVEHWLQDPVTDEYHLDATEVRQGYTQSVPDGFARQYEGFYAIPVADTPIAADGSTVIRVYYMRYYYLLDIEAPGAYGSDPIYARYGAPISVNDPTKPGYAFAGWNKQVPTTMPARNERLTATWTAQSVGYTVTYLYENADDDGYTPVGIVTRASLAGSEVNPADLSDINSSDEERKFFTFDAEKTGSVPVTIAGDGTTNVNVYYKRNEYTINFNAYLSNDRVMEQVYSFTAKYDAAIDALWPTKDLADSGSDATLKAAFDHGHRGMLSMEYISGWKLGNSDSTYSSKRLRMTSDLCNNASADHTYVATAQYDARTQTSIYYYLESLDQTSRAGANRVYHNGTYYDLSPTLSQTNVVNGSWSAKELTGFTNVDTEKGNYWSWLYHTYRFYYSRDVHIISLSSAGEIVGKADDVPYEKPLGDVAVNGTSLASYVPDYPSSFMPSAYTFSGWYRDADCTDGPVNFTKETMPSTDSVYYAKWEPVTFDVGVYRTEADANAGSATLSRQNVKFGEYAALVDTPEYGNYQFVGWFYRDADGSEHGFSFSGKAITGNVNVYAKWTSDVVVRWNVSYQTTDGTPVADSLSGHDLAGTAKTFRAVSDTLYPTYREGWFPDTTSHTIMLGADGDNEYTFTYENLGSLPYTVRYVSATTGAELLPAKTIETKKAAVTEMSVPIEGMIPDHFMKSLVVSPNGGNEIVFRYTPDTLHAFYLTQKYVEDPTAESGWRLYNSAETLANIGDSVTADTSEIAGYTLDTTVNGTNLTGTVTTDGLILKVYYRAKRYPYRIRCVNRMTGQEISHTDGEAAFGGRLTVDAPSLEGWDLYGDAVKTIVIMKDTDEILNNVITFWYVVPQARITYIPISTEMGAVSNGTETVAAYSGMANGSTPLPMVGFVFAGWYLDEACTQPVTETDGVTSDDGTFVPSKRIVDGRERYVTATYYARFVIAPAAMPVTGMGGPIDPWVATVLVVVGVTLAGTRRVRRETACLR